MCFEIIERIVNDPGYKFLAGKLSTCSTFQLFLVLSSLSGPSYVYVFVVFFCCLVGWITAGFFVIAGLLLYCKTKQKK